MQARIHRDILFKETTSPPTPMDVALPQFPDTFSREKYFSTGPF